MHRRFCAVFAPDGTLRYLLADTLLQDNIFLLNVTVYAEGSYKNDVLKTYVFRLDHQKIDLENPNDVSSNVSHIRGDILTSDKTKLYAIKADGIYSFDLSNAVADEIFLWKNVDISADFGSHLLRVISSDKILYLTTSLYAQSTCMLSLFIRDSGIQQNG